MQVTQATAGDYQIAGDMIPAAFFSVELLKGKLPRSNKGEISMPTLRGQGQQAMAGNRHQTGHAKRGAGAKNADDPVIHDFSREDKASRLPHRRTASIGLSDKIVDQTPPAQSFFVFFATKIKSPRDIGRSAEYPLLHRAGDRDDRDVDLLNRKGKITETQLFKKLRK